MFRNVAEPEEINNAQNVSSTIHTQTVNAMTSLLSLIRAPVVLERMRTFTVCMRYSTIARNPTSAVGKCS